VEAHRLAFAGRAARAALGCSPGRGASRARDRLEKSAPARRATPGCRGSRQRHGAVDGISKRTFISRAPLDLASASSRPSSWRG
jgi:hypothetical protein